jgi:putative membrane protein
LEVLNFWFVNVYIPKSQDKEKAYKRYDLFTYIVALPLLVGGLVVVYLAVVKP